MAKADTPLSKTLLESVGAPLQKRLEARRDLDETLRQLVATAAAAHPDLGLAPRDFVAHLASHLRDDEDVDDLGAVNAPDLYLACACAKQLPAALRVFEKEHLPRLRTVLTRQGASDLEADDVMSQLGEKLLVPGESGPRIAGYAGRGSLSQWLRAAAVRALIDHRRVERPRDKVADDIVAALPASGASPEFSALQADGQQAFTAAFLDALASLSDRERTLLRMHAVERSTIDDIGALYQVHRVTAFRWVEAARQKLVDGTRARLKQRWNTDSAQFESLARGMGSAVDISLRTALKND